MPRGTPTRSNSQSCGVASSSLPSTPATARVLGVEVPPGAPFPWLPVIIAGVCAPTWAALSISGLERASMASL
jgi:hypothetical protein